MKRILLTALSVFAAVAGLMAQPALPAKCEASMPRVLNGIILNEKDADALLKSADLGQGSGTGKYWIAYSDRENNTTYNGPQESSGQCSSLKFNEAVRIAKIQDKFALVYVEPNKQTVYPKISADAKSCGWIPLSRLLLWNSCLANERGIYNKALLCVNLDKSRPQVENFGLGYLEPSEKSKYTVKLTSDMNFYYIMKREEGMVLLATQSKMDGAFSNQVLFCWAPEQSYVPWNQRSCLEPTWKHEDVEYFAAKNITADVFGNKGMTDRKISWIPFKKKESSTYDQYLYRMDGKTLRYPILDDGSSSIYNMSTFSTLGGPTGDPVNPVTDAEKIQEEKLKKMQHINLAIVIDGTSSMEPYYPAVKDAIKKGLEYFEKNNKIKVGVVIYRDYADGEKGLVEIKPLTDAKNISIINNFLDSGGSYGIKSSPNDKTITEAFYYGLNEACDKLSFNKEESNIILVVGDCGNDANDTRCASREEIIKKIVDKNIHLMGFQVRNQNISAFTSFNTQLFYIMRNSLLGHYKKLDPKIKVTANEVKTGGVSEGYDYSANVNHQLYIGKHRFANANVNQGKMDPKKLTSHMTSAISEFAKTIEAQLNLVVNANKVGAIMPGTKDNSADRINIDSAFVGTILGDEWYEAMKGQNALVNFRGYVKKKDASGRDFFKPVIFISMEEFDDLLKRLAPVYEAASSSQTKDRTPYIEAMKALVRSLVPGISDSDMARLSNGQITAMIGGLNEAAASLKSYTLDDLSDQRAVTAAEYLRIITDFQRKYKNLKNIRSSKSYKFVKEFNGARYYWIPIEDLP